MIRKSEALAMASGCSQCGCSHQLGASLKKVKIIFESQLVKTYPVKRSGVGKRLISEKCKEELCRVHSVGCREAAMLRLKSGQVVRIKTSGLQIYIFMSRSEDTMGSLNTW